MSGCFYILISTFRHASHLTRRNRKGTVSRHAVLMWICILCAAFRTKHLRIPCSFTDTVLSLASQRHCVNMIAAKSYFIQHCSSLLFFNLVIIIRPQLKSRNIHFAVFADRFMIFYQKYAQYFNKQSNIHFQNSSISKHIYFEFNQNHEYL